MSKGKLFKTFKDKQNARGEEARVIRKIAAIILAAIVTFLVIGGAAGFFYIKSVLEPVDPDSEEKVEVVIPIGSSTSTIASILEENGIIKNAVIFRFYTKVKNETEFQAGEYTFQSSMTMDEIIESLKSGRIVLEPDHRITIPEGLTVEEIADIFAKHFSFTSDDFLEKANDAEYIEELIEKYSAILSDDILQEDIRTPLEGYLYAITYDFYEEDPSVETVIEMMLDRTALVVQPYLEQIEETGFTIHEALTFASLVEKETGRVDQRSMIAGVFYNRLDEGMRLQTDPTVLYALGEHKDRVLYKDLEVESPYNTYFISGLPIGPISNFAESSLEAVVNPEKSGYFYFLHDPEGNIYYAETLDEHNENIADYMN